MSWVNTLFLSGTMLLAGVGIPVMAALNSSLGARLGNPVQAAVILFSLGLLCSVAALLIQNRPINANILTAPAHFYLGGILVAFYILAVTFIAPKLGVGTTNVLVLLGQAIAAATIDHFALLDAKKNALTVSRGLGVLLIACGAFLIQSATRID